MSCCIRFEKNNRWHLTYLQYGGKNLYKAEQFAVWLQQYSLAAITSVSASQIRAVTNEERTGDYGSVSLFANTKMRCEENGIVYGVILPAPDASVFDEHQEVKPEWGIACAAQYSILAGVTFTFTKGALCGSSV